MKSTIEREVEDSPDIRLKVRAAQIEQLYNQSWIGLIGVHVVATCVCVVLWQFLPPWKLLSWLGILTLVTIARGYLIAAFRRKESTKVPLHTWARWHVIGTSGSGLTWAFPSFFLWPESAPEFHFVWALCTLPLSASAVSTYFTWKPSYISFVFLSVIPVALRFFYEGGLPYIVLGFLALFFIAALIQAGALIHANSLRMLFVGYRNEALSAFLANEKTKQEELTQQLQTAHDQLQKISLTDELTGLWNRRYLKATIQKDIAQVLRDYRNGQQEAGKHYPNNRDIVFIMIDLDHFKAVNDTYGHGAGDQVLRQLGNLLKQSCRETDTAIRWGGEEFLIVSINVQRENDTNLVERIRHTVEKKAFDIGEASPLHLTCSIGASVFPFMANSPEALSWEKAVDLADTCLYAAKSSGRNAWVTIISTDLTISDDITSNMTRNLPRLINQGKLQMKTNLHNNIICWPE